MDDQQLQEFDRLNAKRTPGPYYETTITGYDVMTKSADAEHAFIAEAITEADRDYIVWACNAAPELVNELRFYRAAAEQAQKALDAVLTQDDKAENAAIREEYHERFVKPFEDNHS